ncbi:ankyrin [Rhizoclosmatium globosum]|uniref:Ankyrin n=1 Tax=Rhizoclosmatium globosum TaxID=329046 RepID=A0A1Y2CZR8_9FUNG|nr:ankyrin [Rhizoclosmatium globosum]|eukprot:ORY52366.1 ankyrin [Rhizoclosmatium globosum]
MSSRPQSSAAPPNEKPTTADKENRVVSVIAPPKSPKSGKKKALSSAGSKEAAPSRSASALKNPTSTKASTVSLGGKSAKSKSLAQISTNGSAKDKRPLSAKSMTLTPSVTTKSPLKQQPPEPVDVSKPLSSSEAVLMEACKTGDVDAVYNCVWEKVNLNCRLPYYGTTPLSMAFRHGHKQLCNVLINFGAKFDPDNYGATPVHWAASHGHSKLIKDQFQRGHISRPDLQRRDTFGSTPLHFASVNNLTDCVQTLLDCGSDSLVTNNDGRTASMITSDDGIRNILGGEV